MTAGGVLGVYDRFATALPRPGENGSSANPRLAADGKESHGVGIQERIRRSHLALSSVVSHIRLDNRRDPLTRLTLADENASSSHAL